MQEPETFYEEAVTIHMHCEWWFSNLLIIKVEFALVRGRKTQAERKRKRAEKKGIDEEDEETKERVEYEL